MPLFEQDSSVALQENPCSCLSLTWEQRLYGFIGCFLTGLVVTIISLVNLGLANLVGFGILYTVGNVLSLLSSLFLIGPMKQLKMMTAPTRLVAFLIYLGTMVGTFYFAFKTGKVLITLIFVIIQFFALMWYCASYVPFARRMIKNVFGGLI